MRRLARYLRRLRVAALTAGAVFVVDHAVKLIVVALPGDSYVQNNLSNEFVLWLPAATAALAALIPNSLVVLGGGLILGGGASNIADSYLWPGGVPDFIPFGDSDRNVADFCINAGQLFIVAGIAIWGWRLLRSRRRDRLRQSRAQVEMILPAGVQANSSSGAPPPA